MESVHWRQVVITVIALLVAAAHLWTGPDYAGPAPAFVTGYAMDILIPFSSYFLLCAAEVDWKPLRPWWRKVLLVFAVISSAEVAQAYGYPVFGNTCDPMDLLAYGVGAVVAALVDRQILARWEFWTEF
jgi:hypothetical protein